MTMTYEGVDRGTHSLRGLGSPMDFPFRSWLSSSLSAEQSQAHNPPKSFPKSESVSKTVVVSGSSN